MPTLPADFRVERRRIRDKRALFPIDLHPASRIDQKCKQILLAAVQPRGSIEPLLGGWKSTAHSCTTSSKSALNSRV